MNPSIIYCSICGTRNKSTADYCFGCGKPLQISTLVDLSGTSPLSHEHMLKQRYRIVTLVGQGGMGAVYKAEDTQFGGRIIAVKEMNQSNLTLQEISRATEQFKQEAHMLVNLKHPNLPSIYDYFSENGRWYLVIDFIEGTTLDARLANTPKNVLTVVETLDIGIQLTKVLGYLHTRHIPIIFRDLKPRNIMITPENDIYLIDFGIARLFKPGKTQDTVAYVSAGYAAPEQFGQAQTSPQSDVYSLGATLHQLLSGTKPSSNAPLFTFKALKEYNSNIPTPLADLVSKMVNIDPGQRPASMAIVRQELERIQILLKQPIVSLPLTQYTPPPLKQYTSPPPIEHILPPPSAQKQVYHTPTSPSITKPALPKGVVWKTLLIGIVMAIPSLSLLTATVLSIDVKLAIVTISLIVVGFVTGRVITRRIFVFFIGCLAGTAFAKTGVITSSNFINVVIIEILLFMFLGGLLSLLGAWLAKITHPSYKHKKP